MATTTQRARMVRMGYALIAHEPAVHYSQIRPYTPLTWRQTLARFAAGQGIVLDCSAAFTKLCQWAGLADPNGRGYDGSGYTGTLLEHLPHYFNPARALAGAGVIFGPGTGEHACMVLEPDARNPLLFSHGMERGPVAIRLHDEAQYHNPPTTFLSIAGL